MSKVLKSGWGTPGLSLHPSRRKVLEGQVCRHGLPRPAGSPLHASGILDGGQPSVSWAGTGERQCLQGRPERETRGPAGLPLDCGRERDSGQHEGLTSPRAPSWGTHI